jgi:hypothetical protein
MSPQASFRGSPGAGQAGWGSCAGCRQPIKAEWPRCPSCRCHSTLCFFAALLHARTPCALFSFGLLARAHALSTLHTANRVVYLYARASRVFVCVCACVPAAIRVYCLQCHSKCVASLSGRGSRGTSGGKILPVVGTSVGERSLPPSTLSLPPSIPPSLSVCLSVCLLPPPVFPFILNAATLAKLLGPARP